MRVFISYASVQRETADRIAVGLYQEGYEVFYDRDALPPGEGFDATIRKEVARADLFLFLISPESVRPGAYTLTEMEQARRRWKDPSGHVLPVLVVKTPIANVPAYLCALTILEPRGNLVAEVLTEVTRLTRGRQRLHIWSGVAATVVGVIAVWIFLRQDAVNGACFLEAEVILSRAALAREHKRLTLSVTGGVNQEFFLSERGSGPIEVAREQLGRWGVKLVDAQGNTLGTAHLNGCPRTSREVRLNGDILLRLRPR